MTALSLSAVSADSSPAPAPSPAPALPVAPDLLRSMERVVLGSCLYLPEALTQAADFLTPDDFSAPEHRVLFAALLAMREVDCPPGPLSAGQWLEQAGRLDQAGGMAYLCGLEAETDIPARIPYYAAQIQDASRERTFADRLLALADAAQRGTDRRTLAAQLLPLADDAPPQAQQEAFAMDALMGEVFDGYEEAVALRQSGRTCLGLDTGFQGLNDFLNGLCPEELSILAARPSIGKSSLALQIALHVAEAENAHVAFFSLEMSRRQVGGRMACARARLSYDRFRKGLLPDADLVTLTRHMGTLQALPITVLETPGLTIAQLRGHLDRLQRRRKVDLVIVDHIHLMTGPGQGLTERTTHLSNALRALSLRTGSPHFFCLAQLSRKPEERPDKRPEMGDLRESGALDQDAVNILYLHRPGHYADQRAKYKGDLDDFLGYAELLVPKTRFGPTGDCPLRWLPDLALFANPEPTLHDAAPAPRSAPARAGQGADRRPRYPYPIEEEDAHYAADRDHTSPRRP